MNIRAEGKPALKIGGRKLFNDLMITIIFSISILSSSFRIWLDLNNGLE